MSLSPSLMPVTCALPPTASASPLSLSLLHCSGCCCCHHHLRSVDGHPPPSPAGDDDGGHRRDDVGSRARLHRFIHSARRRRSRRGRCCCSPADPSFRPAAETWGRCGVAWGDPWVWHGGWVQVVGVGSQHSTLAITWCRVSATSASETELPALVALVESHMRARTPSAPICFSRFSSIAPSAASWWSIFQSPE